MKKNVYKLLSMLFVFGLFTLSCEDVKIEEPQIDLETTQDNALAERTIGQLFGTIYDLSNSSAVKGLPPESCPTYSWNNYILTITYSGCIDNGVTKSGQIIANFQNFDGFWNANTTVSITFNNYTVDGTALSGTILVECNAVQPFPVFTLTSDNMVLTFSDQKTISWDVNTTYTMTYGYNTFGDKSDDEWKINGVNNGIARNGKSFKRELINLFTSASCKYFIEGVLKLTIEETDVYEVEFHNTCGSITITYNGVSVNRTLP